MYKILELEHNKFVKIISSLYLKLEYVIYFVVSLLSSASVFMIFFYKTYQDFLNRKWLLLFLFFSVILFIIMIFNIKKNYKKIEKLFLIFAIPIGLLFLIFLLPPYVPDEQAHLFRAYDISCGNLITDMEVQRQSIPDDILKLENSSSRANNYFSLIEKVKENTDYNSTKKDIFNAAEGYPFIIYILSSTICFISRILSLNLYIMVYLCRMANFIFFLLLGHYLIKILPFGKLVMFVYMLSPMVMQQAISVSADSFINIVSLLFMAFTLKVLFDKEKLSLKEKVIYTLLVICVSFSKYVYFPIVFMALLLFSRKDLNKKDKIFIIIISIVAILLALTSCYIGMQYKDIRTYIIENNVNSNSQLKYIVNNPIRYINILKNTLIEKSEIYFFQFLGYDLGLLEIKGNYVISSLYFLLLFIAPFFEKNTNSLNKIQKVWILLIFTIISILIFTGLYMGWTTVGGEIIQGVQGRYFIPIIILPLMCFIIKNKYIEFKYINIVISLLLCFINYISIYSIINFFTV